MNKNDRDSRRFRDNIAIDICEGSVLAIPLIVGKWALGQVLVPGISFYLGVVIESFEEPMSASDIDQKKLSLRSWTNDAEIFKGRWKNLGRYTLQTGGTFPEYKVTEDNKVIVKSFRGEKLRDFDPYLDHHLQYRTSRSPLLVEDAVRAACGFGTWKPYYGKMMEQGGLQ